MVRLTKRRASSPTQLRILPNPPLGIVFRLGIINQVIMKKIDTSVIRTFHLSGMAAISQWTKGSG